MLVTGKIGYMKGKVFVMDNLSLICIDIRSEQLVVCEMVCTFIVCTVGRERRRKEVERKEID